MTSRLFFSLSLFLAFCFSQPLMAQPITYRVQPDESTMQVSGTSTVHDWACPVEELSGTIKVDTSATGATTAAPSLRVTSAQITVPVEQIVCENGTMNEKLRDALKANAYPVILYNLRSATVQPLPDSSASWFQVEATGQLILAGERQTIEMTVKGHRLSDGRIRFVGDVPILMSNFDIKPPSAMLGMLDTGDRVVVHFDVLTTSAQG